MDLLTQAALAIRRVIETCPLAKIQQDEILRTMAAIPIRVRAVAEAAQSRNGNGSRPGRRGRKRKPAQKKQAAKAEQPAAVQADG